ncbi:TPA: hypothetical protein I8Y18_003539 [Raoultella ornithinolytica]|nr:hypothetical protein [Raoultella ornithinolytica]
MTDNIDLFQRLTTSRMMISDVRECLKMPQSDFLTMLCEGAESYLAKPVNRVEFSFLAEITPKSAYSYFASPDAKDYRHLSDDMRIAMIWRVSSKCDPQISSQPPTKKASSRIYKLKSSGCVVHFTIAELAEKYRAAKKGTLRFKRGEHWPDVYLSDFVESSNRAQFNRNKFYLVNGEKLSLSEASKALGYKHPSALSQKMKSKNIQEGTDISQLIHKERNLYLVNGEELTLLKASKALGYMNPSTLSKKLAVKNIQNGADISHLTYERRSKRRKNDKPE